MALRGQCSGDDGQAPPGAIRTDVDRKEANGNGGGRGKFGR